MVHHNAKGITTMLTKTKITLIAALLLGSASGAFASVDADGADVDIFRPTTTVSVPAHENHANRRAQPVSGVERNWMDRASQSFG